MRAKSKVSKSDLEGLCTTRTATEKLYEAFREKYSRIWQDAGTGMRDHDIVDLWEDILSAMKGVKHIKKLSDLASPLDYLIEQVNKPGWDKVVIRDPGQSGNFIVIERDFADKIVVLGHLP